MSFFFSQSLLSSFSKLLCRYRFSLSHKREKRSSLQNITTNARARIKIIIIIIDINDASERFREQFGGTRAKTVRNDREQQQQQLSFFEQRLLEERSDDDRRRHNFQQ